MIKTGKERGRKTRKMMIREEEDDENWKGRRV